MNLNKIMNMVKSGGLFPVTCHKCNTTMNNLAEATAHYNTCTSTQKMTQKHLEEEENNKK